MNPSLSRFVKQWVVAVGLVPLIGLAAASDAEEEGWTALPPQTTAVLLVTGSDTGTLTPPACYDSEQ